MLNLKARRCLSNTTKNPNPGFVRPMNSISHPRYLSPEISMTLPLSLCPFVVSVKTVDCTALQRNARSIAPRYSRTGFRCIILKY